MRGLLGVCLLIVSLSSLAYADKGGQCAKTLKTLPLTAKARFLKGGAQYRAGCQAAAHYVQGTHIGAHSSAWNAGFSDCRFNVYRSSLSERQAEKICGY